jgi:hypothetical protein
MPEATITPTINDGDEADHKTRLASTVLILFTVVVAATCIGLLSSTLTQSRIVSNLTADGTSVGIRKLNYLGLKWADIRNNIDSKSDKRRGTEAQNNALASAAAVARVTVGVKKKDTEALLVEFYYRMSTSESDADKALAEHIHQKGYDTQVAYISAAKTRLDNERPELASLLKRIDDTYNEFRDADRAASIADVKKQVNQEEIAFLDQTITQEKSALKEFFDLIKLNMDDDGRARVENAFYELNVNNYNSGPLSYLTYRTLTTRSEILTLWLVIFMGILGSALQITHAYFMKNQVQSIGGYFQRLVVGAMTALVIFIVAKAGVPILADPSRLGGDSPINPYFVSFLAIVSGLLSENAIANIQEQGTKVFGSGTAGPNRWARNDLFPDLQTQNLSIGKLAEHLHKPEEVVKAMLEGKEAITPIQQDIIAIYLRREARDLFTDVPSSQQDVGS